MNQQKNVADYLQHLQLSAMPAARHSQCTFSPDFLVALRTSGGRWNPYRTHITLYGLMDIPI